MRFGRGLLSVFSGNLLAQLFQIAAIPALTRMYGPENYGKYGLFAAALFFTSMLASMRYELAIQLPKSQGIASSISGLAILIIVSFSFIVFFGVLFVATHYGWTEAPIIFSALLGVNTFFIGIYNVFNALSIRASRFNTVSIGRIVQVVVTVSAAMGFYYYHQLSFGLLYANVVGYACACVLMVWIMRHEIVWRINHRALQSWLIIAKRYSSFSVFNAPQAAIDGLRPIAVVSVIQSVFGGAAVGSYHIANQLIQTPASLITQSASQVYYRFLVASLGSDRYRRKLKFFLILLTVIASLSVPITLYMSSLVVSLLFGDKWIGLDQLINVLIWLASINIVVGVSVFIFHARRMHGEFFVWGAFYNIACFAGIVIGGCLHDEMVDALKFYVFFASVSLVALGLRSAFLTFFSRK